MASWRNQEVLASRRCEKTLQPIVIRGHSAVRAPSSTWVRRVDRLEIQGSCGITHTNEEVGGRHKDGELQFGLLTTIWHVARAETRPIHTNMNGGTIGGP